MTTIYKFIVKWEGGKNGNPILFFPEYRANLYKILCYVHLGQHSEAHLGYYWGLRNPDKKNPKHVEEVKRLIAEYQTFMQPSERMQQVYRDNRKMRKEREI